MADLGEGPGAQKEEKPVGQATKNRPFLPSPLSSRTSGSATGYHTFFFLILHSMISWYDLFSQFEEVFWPGLVLRKETQILQCASTLKKSICFREIFIITFKLSHILLVGNVKKSFFLKWKLQELGRVARKTLVQTLVSRATTCTWDWGQEGGVVSRCDQLEVIFFYRSIN